MEINQYETIVKRLDTIEKRLDVIENYSKLSAKNVLTMADVMLLTGLSKSCLYKLTHSKEIPFYKPSGKMLYFKRDEVEAWMLQNRKISNNEIEAKVASYLCKIK